MDPVYELLAEKYTTKYSKNDIVFAKIDVQQMPDAADLFQIQGLPAFRAIYKGQLVGEADGADTPGLSNMVEIACAASGIQATLRGKEEVLCFNIPGPVRGPDGGPYSIKPGFGR